MPEPSRCHSRTEEGCILLVIAVFSVVQWQHNVFSVFCVSSVSFFIFIFSPSPGGAEKAWCYPQEKKCVQSAGIEYNYYNT